MKFQTIPLEQTGIFSGIFLDYLTTEKLKKFYSNPPVPEGIAQQIKLKKFQEDKRKVLVRVLESQYKDIEPHDKVNDNIAALKNKNTFTVTTGHQLNIFTGPLYFIYKIVTCINLARKLNEQFNDYHFVPVYWMASEDHDFEEIRKIHLNGREISWSSNQKGPVGRFHCDGIDDAVNEIPGNPDIFREAYSQYDTLAEAVRYYVNNLFGEYGLVILDPDNKSLKAQFSDIIKDDIINHSAYHLVNEQSKELQKIGYSTQVNPRKINLFYIEDQLRERIIRQKDTYIVHETSLSFTEDEIVKEIESNPEKFSPNVTLRPVYQESTLPNLAYIGGPAEIAYWLQYKKMFDHYKVPLPVLMPRNFAAFLDRPTFRKFEKTGIELPDLFMPKGKLVNKVVKLNTSEEIDLTNEKENFKKEFEKIKVVSTKIDKSLNQMIDSEFSKLAKTLERIEKKLIRAEKRKHSEKIAQIESVLQELFPDGNLQERYINILHFYFDYPDLIDQMIQNFDPFNFAFNIVISDEKAVA